MTPAEIVFAERLIHSRDRVRLSQHARNQMKAHGLNVVDVARAVKFGSLIEVNSLGRCVIRHASGAVAVLCVRTGDIVTVWFNTPDDNHKTLNASNYGWRVNVIDYLARIAVQ
jgi:hypothetical protein